MGKQYFCGENSEFDPGCEDCCEDCRMKLLIADFDMADGGWSESAECLDPDSCENIKSWAFDSDMMMRYKKDYAEEDRT
jgi:hypothetical protein